MDRRTIRSVTLERTTVDFGLAPEHRELLEVARRVAAEIAPGYVQRDLAERFPWDLPPLLARAKLLGLNVAVEAGGQGAGELATGLVAEVLATADRQAAGIVLAASTACKLIGAGGNDELRETWLPPILAGEVTIALGLTESQSGSDLADVRTTAVASGDAWVIDGEKSSVSMSKSQAAIILARTEDGPELFLIPADAAGITFGFIADMGVRPSQRAIMNMTGVRVPLSHCLSRSAGGLRAILALLTTGRLLVCMISIGIAARALDDAVAWAKQRQTFGKMLSERQGVAFPLVDAMTEVELARLICLKGLWMADQGMDFRREAAMAKSWIPRAMTRACHESMLTFGHIGYSAEHTAQLLYRDAIGYEIGEGPENIQKILLSRLTFGKTPS